jgi:hypothetical protein
MAPEMAWILRALHLFGPLGGLGGSHSADFHFCKIAIAKVDAWTKVEGHEQSQPAQGILESCSQWMSRNLDLWPFIFTFGAIPGVSLHLTAPRNGF